MNDTEADRHEAVGVFHIVVLVLSTVLLGILVADTAFNLPQNISNVLQTIDTLICIVFLMEFGIRFYKAESKLAFMKWGWIDLVASIPNLQIFQWGRFVRVLRIIRLFRALRATHKITALLLKKKTQGGIASVILTFFLLIMFSSVGILICEQHEPDANIKTAGDAIWWSVSTITTVGYAAKEKDGAPWVVLTNGAFWRIYKISDARPIAYELVLGIEFASLKHTEPADLEKLFLLTKESWSKSALRDYYDQKQALSKFSISAVVLGDPVLSLIRRELKRISPDVKIDAEQIRSVLIEEVLKREVVEGEKYDEACKRITKAANKAMRSKSEKDSSEEIAAIQSPAATIPLTSMT